jgi:hypothetical protein
VHDLLIEKCRAGDGGGGSWGEGEVRGVRGGGPAGSRCLNALDLHGSSGKQDNERTKQPIRDQNDKYLHQSEARMHGLRSSRWKKE